MIFVTVHSLDLCFITFIFSLLHRYRFASRSRLYCGDVLLCHGYHSLARTCYSAVLGTTMVGGEENRDKEVGGGDGSGDRRNGYLSVEPCWEIVSYWVLRKVLHCETMANNKPLYNRAVQALDFMTAVKGNARVRKDELLSIQRGDEEEHDSLYSASQLESLSSLTAPSVGTSSVNNNDSSVTSVSLSESTSRLLLKESAFAAEETKMKAKKVVSPRAQSSIDVPSSSSSIQHKHRQDLNMEHTSMRVESERSTAQSPVPLPLPSFNQPADYEYSYPPHNSYLNNSHTVVNSSSNIGWEWRGRGRMQRVLTKAVRSSNSYL